MPLKNLEAPFLFQTQVFCGQFPGLNVAIEQATEFLADLVEHPELLAALMIAGRACSTVQQIINPHHRIDPERQGSFPLAAR